MNSFRSAVFGGILIYIVTMTAEHVGPKEAALLSSIPIIDLISVASVTSLEKRSVFAFTAMKSNLVVVAMYVALIVFLFSSRSNSVIMSLFVGASFWFLGSSLLYIGIV